MISHVIAEINKGLTKLFETVAGAKVYGLAQTMLKDGKYIPALVDNSGEGKYIGIDDVSPVITYHKLNSITSALNKTNSYGDTPGIITNTHNNTIIVYLNRKRLKILPDELFLFIQARIPDSAQLEPFKSISIKITNVILSSEQVWAMEYKRDFTLPPEANLFAVNYTIESSFKKGCFDKCI